METSALTLCAALGLRLDPATPDVVALVGGGGKSHALFQLGREIAAGGQRALLTCTTHLSHDQVAGAPALVTMDGDELPFVALSQALATHGQCLVMGLRREGPRSAGLTAEQVDDLAAQAPTLNVAALVIEADGSRLLPLKAPAAHEPVLPAATTLLVPVAGAAVIGRRLAPENVQRPELVASILGCRLDAAPRLTPGHLATLMTHPAGGAKGLRAGMRLVPLLNQVETPDRLAAARLIAARWAAAGIRSVIAALGRPAGAWVRERWGPWAVVLMAAGASSRLGTPKQLLPVAGEPMVCRVARTALASDAAAVVVVTGAHAEAVRAALAPLEATAQGRLVMVHHPEWARGQAGSMQAGLAALPPAIDAVVFLPVDQPNVTAALLRRLAREWRAGAGLVAPEVNGEVRGAPALFDRAHWPALRLVRGDVGGRVVLRANAASVARLAVDADLLRDVDTPADWVDLAGPRRADD